MDNFISTLPTRTVSARSVVKVATPTSTKPKSSKNSKTKPKK